MVWHTGVRTVKYVPHISSRCSLPELSRVLTKTMQRFTLETSRFRPPATCASLQTAICSLVVRRHSDAAEFELSEPSRPAVLEKMQLSPQASTTLPWFRYPTDVVPVFDTHLCSNPGILVFLLLPETNKKKRSQKKKKHYAGHKTKLIIAPRDDTVTTFCSFPSACTLKQQCRTNPQLQTKNMGETRS